MSFQTRDEDGMTHNCDTFMKAFGASVQNYRIWKISWYDSKSKQSYRWCVKSKNQKWDAADEQYLNEKSDAYREEAKSSTKRFWVRRTTFGEIRDVMTDAEFYHYHKHLSLL
jgi:hypothetical protein